MMAFFSAGYQLPVTCLSHDDGPSQAVKLPVSYISGSPYKGILTGFNSLLNGVVRFFLKVFSWTARFSLRIER
jgi:hypothetical protein